MEVRAFNADQPNSRWYSGAGIYRPVKLWTGPEKHVELNGVKLKTLSLDPPRVEITVKTAGEGPVSVELLDGDKVLAAAEGEERSFTLSVPGAEPWSVDAPKLWSAETPHLYTCAAKTATDERRVRFGIRELKWNAKNGLVVNGETVKLRGGCIHHDHGVLGACEYRESELRRIRILKENGFNAIRVSHNPASQILLDACDELGMYVIDEAFDGWYTPKTYHDYARWFRSDWQNDLRSMVESAYNHPCVILYSVGNEVTETAEQEGIELCGRMRDYVHSLDNTRPVTAGINVLLDVYASRGIGIYKDKGEYKPEPLPENGSFPVPKVQPGRNGSCLWESLRQRTEARHAHRGQLAPFSVFYMTIEA